MTSPRLVMGHRMVPCERMLGTDDIAATIAHAEPILVCAIF